MRQAIALIVASGAVLAQTAPLVDDLFDDRVLHEVRLWVHPRDWRNLRINYLDNTYYPAEFEWNGIVIVSAGIRSRGNGSRHPDKPGLRVDFDRYEPGQEFLGLKSLVLDNLVQDQTMMGERLAMALFRRMGVAAPRVAHARLIVNGVLVGLYTLVEPVDKGFLSRSLEENGGYLYDYEWMSDYNFEYLGDDPALYSPLPFEPQTHEKDPEPAPLERMIHAINQSADDEFDGAVSSYLDPRRFLDYLAVETFIAEQDGVLGDWGLNNFYLYRAETGLSVFIPWDKDVTFRQVDRSIWQNVERNVLARRLLAIPEYREYYLHALESVSDAAGGEWLAGQIETACEQIRLAVAEDPNKPFTYGQFEEGIAILREFAALRAAKIADEIAAGR
jgi:spore coat protein CotH